MTVERRRIFADSAVETPKGDLGAEGTHSAEPKSTGALGDQTAHNDPSLAAWKANAHRPALGVGIEQDGAAGITVGGE